MFGRVKEICKISSPNSEHIVPETFSMGQNIFSARGTLVIAAICAFTLSLEAQTPRSSKKALSLTARQIAQKVTRSLVVIRTKDTDGELLAQGSGFFFGPGLVATNLHVFKRAWGGSIEVVHTGKRYEVTEILGVDLSHDVCVFRVTQESTSTLSLNMSRQDAVGDDIYVSGNPEGLTGSFSKGIISAIRKDPDLIQIDASISPGSSGGPVVNSRGEVIGIAVGGLSSGEHLNFAVPVKFLTSLSLKQNLPVNLVGALAVKDKEDQKLRGPVRTIVIKKSHYRRLRDRSCIEAEARLDQRLSYDLRGNETESTNFNSKGGILWQYQSEYDSRGFKKRVITIHGDGSRAESNFSDTEWINLN
jgi:hypothetical protein